MAGVALAGAAFRGSAPIAVILLIYAWLSALGWPILEGLLSSGLESRALSWRIAVYNIIWSGAGALVLAINGLIIEHWPQGVFLIPAILHASCTVMIMVIARPSQTASGRSIDVKVMPVVTPPAPEPDLVSVRTLALWLSRVALPATYVVIYSLAALMPSLPVMSQLDEARKTLLGSTWMAARWLTFLTLGFGVWWHARPRLLLAAAALMLISFLGVVVRPSDFFAGGSIHGDLVAMAVWQVGLGVALGVIYTASLYFGMVLSEGSTEHGGYHEALIGLGSILGPGVGAAAASIRPGDLQLGIESVVAVIALSVVVVFITSIAAGKRSDGKM